MSQEYLYKIMKDTLIGAKAITAIMLGYFLGLHWIMQLLIYFMFIDIATGFLSGYVSQTLDSSVSFRGMAKKAIVLFIVGMATLLGMNVGIELGAYTAAFYALHEGLSILENAGKAGLPIPTGLKEALVKVSENLMHSTIQAISKNMSGVSQYSATQTVQTKVSIVAIPQGEQQETTTTSEPVTELNNAIQVENT